MAGVVVATQLGVRATVLYLVTYLLMNLTAFAVIVARERETTLGDDIDSLAGLGTERPVLAWSMTIAMLSLAGIPVTAGFIGKVYLIQAAVDGGYAWLAVVIVLGSAISLAYYLRVLAAIWMRSAPSVSDVLLPAIAGASPEGPVIHAPARGRHPEVVLVAVLGAAGSLFFGIIPQPLFDLVHGAGSALSGLL
jgi:NADH-quinone oxidoreductase subunit N